MTTPTPRPAPIVRPLSQRTRHAQQQQLTTALLLLVLAGPLTLTAAALLIPLARRPRFGPVLVALLALASLAVAALLLREPYLEAWALIGGLWAAARSGALRVEPPPLPELAAAAWPWLWWWWRWSLPLAPLLTPSLSGLRVPGVEELERARLERERAAEGAQAARAARRAARAPEAAQGAPVLGAPIGAGDLPWLRGGLLTFPPEVLARHFILVGASGVGKSETALRIARLAAAEGWQVFVLDCKGERALGERFCAAMRAAGMGRVASFPEQPYDGWRGDPASLLNRLMEVQDFSEPFYRDLTKLVLDLALNAPGGPPRSSRELLRLLRKRQLAAAYQRRNPEVEGLAARGVDDSYNRFRAFFGALALPGAPAPAAEPPPPPDGPPDALGPERLSGGHAAPPPGLPPPPAAEQPGPACLLDGAGLPGGWSFDTVDAGYIRLDGLALKEQTAGLGRFLLEEFSHYAARRKPAGARALLIIDEFPAIAYRGASAATLFEMIRSHGAAVGITAQSYAAMGADADRILGAAATLILHQCPDPEALLRRAGRAEAFRRRVAFAERGAARARDFATGEGSLALERDDKVDPDRVRAFAPGQCVVISGGCAQVAHVARGAADDRAAPPAAPVRPEAAGPPRRRIGRMGS